MINNDTGTYVSVNGVEMYYEDQGEGPALLLLHGGLGTSKHWESYFSAFSQDYRVIAPHLRGHGRTNNPSKEWDYSIMTDDIAAFIKELDLDKPHICGWSDGAQIGLDLAIRFPDIASSYIIGAAWKDIGETDFETMQKIGIHGPGDVNFKQMEEAAPGFVERVKSFHSSQGAEYWKELLTGISKLWYRPFKYDDEALINIQAPVLFVIGDKDEYLPVETALAMFRLLPNAELAVLPNAGHRIPRTHGNEFSYLVLEFIKRHSAD